MKKNLLLIFSGLLFFAACKKELNVPVNHSKQLFPLASGNEWIYIDSFFDASGFYYGFDTFFLKPAKNINFNNHVYTPINDQYNDSIFIVRSDDSSVFMLEPAGEFIIFSSPPDSSQPVITNSYYGNTLSSIMYTNLITNTNYPAYKIIITQNDGSWADYRQQEFYFTPGLGIIRGRIIWKSDSGSLYTSDSYRLISYTIN